MRRGFEGGEISWCSEISRKYGISSLYSTTLIAILYFLVFSLPLNCSYSDYLTRAKWNETHPQESLHPACMWLSCIGGCGSMFSCMSSSSVCSELVGYSVREQFKGGENWRKYVTSHVCTHMYMYIHTWPTVLTTLSFLIFHRVGVIFAFFSNEQTFRSLENFQESINDVADTGVNYVNDTIRVSCTGAKKHVWLCQTTFIQML